MNTKRLAWLLMAFSAGVLILLLYAQGKQEQRRKALETAAKTTEESAETKPATRPAETHPATAPAADETPETAEEPVAAAEPAAEDETSDEPGPQIVIWGAPEAQGYVMGSFDPSSRFLFQVELTSRGAALETLKLRDYYFTVADKKLAESDWSAYLKALEDGSEEYKGPYSVLNPVSVRGEAHVPMATRAFSLKVGDGDAVRWSDLQNVPWRLESREEHHDGETVRFACDFVRKHPDGRAEPLLRLVKSFRIRRDDYTLYVSLHAENLGDEEVEISVDQGGATGVPREDLRVDMRKVAWGKLQTAGEQQVQVSKKDREAKLANVRLGRRHVAGTSSADEPTLWIGQTNKFFGAMMYLVPRFEDRLQAPEWEAQFYYDEVLESESSMTYATGIRVPAWTIKPGKSQDLELEVFAGPKRREMFADEEADHYRPIYSRLDYLSTIDLRSCICASDWMALQIIRLLRLLSIPTFGNYGLAIIVLVVLVRLALHPLTKRGQVHMQGMKKLGPQMKELEKKYADDKEALNRERMKLYKEQGAAPLLGCLPMLLQMPILIALWTGINASIDLRHAAFLPVWIVDLAAPDRLVTWSEELPLIGNSFNLLPILLAGAMYWQMKLNPQTSGPSATPEQRKQQQMMSLMMPLMMPVFFYQAASGLTLYFLVSTFFGAAEQQIIRKHIEAQEAEEAARETTIQLPGKSPRGSRPRKPKGPNWFKQG